MRAVVVLCLLVSGPGCGRPPVRVGSGTGTGTSTGTRTGAGAGPDLVTTLSAAASQGIVAYRSRVCNIGTFGSSATALDLYYGSLVNAPGDHQLPVAPLQPGACLDLTAQASLLEGTYLSWARVDRGNEVYELREDNNTASVTFHVGPGSGALADLRIIGATATPSIYPTSGATYRLTTCNQGVVSSASSTIAIFYQLAAPPSITSPANKKIHLPALPPGLCSTRYTYAPLQTGSYASGFYVDQQQAVAETNEANNIYWPLKFEVGN